MTAEIISVGTELLLGNILNTNAQYLSRELAALGITVQRESTIGDNHGRLADFVNEAKQRCDLLVFTGGLGPTADDRGLLYPHRPHGHPQQPQAGHGAGARPQGGEPPWHRAGCLV